MSAHFIYTYSTTFIRLLNCYWLSPIVCLGGPQSRRRKEQGFLGAAHFLKPDGGLKVLLLAMITFQLSLYLSIYSILFCSMLFHSIFTQSFSQRIPWCVIEYCIASLFPLWCQRFDEAVSHLFLRLQSQLYLRLVEYVVTVLHWFICRISVSAYRDIYDCIRHKMYYPYLRDIPVV